jgi:chorismate mutase
MCCVSGCTTSQHAAYPAAAALALLQGWNRLTTCENCAGTSDTNVLAAADNLWLSDPTTFINRLDPNTGITMQQIAVRGSPENCCECQISQQPHVLAQCVSHSFFRHNAGLVLRSYLGTMHLS